MSEAETEERDDGVKAGELVLGVLDADERRALETRAARDPAFAALVDFWVARLSPLSGEIASAQPSAELRRRLMAELFPRREAEAGGLWRSLDFWRLFAAGATAVAVACAAALLLFAARPTPERATLIAALTPADAPALLIVEIDPERGYIELRDAAIRALMEEADRTAELWLIPADGVPKSLGLIDPDGDSRTVIPAALRALFEAGAVLAVSIEPPGGSPTGQPTGPVVAAGAVRRF